MARFHVGQAGSEQFQAGLLGQLDFSDTFQVLQGASSWWEGCDQIGNSAIAQTRFRRPSVQKQEDGVQFGVWVLLESKAVKDAPVLLAPAIALGTSCRLLLRRAHMRTHTECVRREGG